MKLTRKHIGKLVHVDGGDGSWVYQLVDIRKGELLLYTFHGTYEIEEQNEQDDWRLFKPTKPWPKKWMEFGWGTGRRYR